jgi:hypothetical protein
MQYRGNNSTKYWNIIPLGAIGASSVMSQLLFHYQERKQDEINIDAQ